MTEPRSHGLVVFEHIIGDRTVITLYKLFGKFVCVEFGVPHKVGH